MSIFEVTKASKSQNAYPVKLYNLNQLSEEELVEYLDFVRGRVMRLLGRSAKANKGICDKRIANYTGIIIYADSEVKRQRYVNAFRRIGKSSPEVRVVKGRKKAQPNKRAWFYLKAANSPLAKVA